MMDHGKMLIPHSGSAVGGGKILDAGHVTKFYQNPEMLVTCLPDEAKRAHFSSQLSCQSLSV